MFKRKPLRLNAMGRWPFHLRIQSFNQIISVFVALVSVAVICFSWVRTADAQAGLPPVELTADPRVFRVGVIVFTVNIGDESRVPEIRNSIVNRLTEVNGTPTGGALLQRIQQTVVPGTDRTEIIVQVRDGINAYARPLKIAPAVDPGEYGRESIVDIVVGATAFYSPVGGWVGNLNITLVHELVHADQMLGRATRVFSIPSVLQKALKAPNNGFGEGGFNNETMFGDRTTGEGNPLPNDVIPGTRLPLLGTSIFSGREVINMEIHAIATQNTIFRELGEEFGIVSPALSHGLNKEQLFSNITQFNHLDLPNVTFDGGWFPGIENANPTLGLTGAIEAPNGIPGFSNADIQRLYNVPFLEDLVDWVPGQPFNPDQAGVNFSNIEFSGITLTADQGANLRVSASPGTGLSRSEAAARAERFDSLFFEGIVFPDSVLNVSLDIGTGAVLDTNFRNSLLARTMLDHDILMKEQYLNQTLTGGGAVNQGVGYQFYESIRTQLPAVWQKFINASTLPSLSLRVRALIIGDVVETVQNGNREFEIKNAPLTLVYQIEDFSIDASQVSLTSQEQTQLQNLANDWLDNVVDTRLSNAVPGFVNRLNTHPDYEDLRLAYRAVAHAKLYKELNRVGALAPTDPFVSSIDLGSLPAARSVPWTSTDDAFYRDQANQKFRVQENANVGGYELVIESRGGVEMEQDPRSIENADADLNILTEIIVEDCRVSPCVEIEPEFNRMLGENAIVLRMFRPDDLRTKLRITNVGNVNLQGFLAEIDGRCRDAFPIVGNEFQRVLATFRSTTVPVPQIQNDTLTYSSTEIQIPWTWGRGTCELTVNVETQQEGNPSFSAITSVNQPILSLPASLIPVLF